MIAAVFRDFGREGLGLTLKEAVREGVFQGDTEEARERAGPSILVVSACPAYIPLLETVPCFLLGTIPSPTLRGWAVDFTPNAWDWAVIG